MQARLIAYPPDQAAISRPVAVGCALRIGRASDCGLAIDHASISRAHAELRARGGGWSLHDMGSKNGSFVEGTRITDAALDKPCWLRLGDVYCEFDLLDDARVAQEAAGWRVRRDAATAHTARIDGVQQLDDLLDASLRGVLELAQCDRGFVLLDDGRHLAVRASLALDPSRLTTREFSGSVGAVARALESGRSVVANDIDRERWLSSRQSVIAGGLRALVCVPLLDGERRLGAIYADRTHAGAAITTLDLELLQAFAERASLWLAARDASHWLANHESGHDNTQDDAQHPGWNDILSAHAGRA